MIVVRNRSFEDRSEQTSIIDEDSCVYFNTNYWNNRNSNPTFPGKLWVDGDCVLIRDKTIALAAIAVLQEAINRAENK